MLNISELLLRFQMSVFIFYDTITLKELALFKFFDLGENVVFKGAKRPKNMD